MAVVKKYDKYGFVNKEGDIIKPQFDRANKFYKGLAVVKKDGKWGFINKKGKIVIQPQFDCVEKFYESIKPLKKGSKSKKNIINLMDILSKKR